METKAITEYSASHAKDKLSFNAYHRPGVNIVKGMQRELNNKQKNLIKKIRINLTGTPMYRANISKCRFFYWTSNWPQDLRRMTRTQYKTYCQKKRKSIWEGKEDRGVWDKRLLWGVNNNEIEKINPFSGELL